MPNGIVKPFKGNMKILIDAWKRSDNVAYLTQATRDRSCRWVRQTWRAVPDNVASQIVKRAGFNSNIQVWHIANHDVYGGQSLSPWEYRQECGHSVVPAKVADNEHSSSLGGSDDIDS